MCAIFGLIDYKNALSARAKEKILKVLSRECEVRGTDATGFAFNHGNHLTVYKRPLPAHKMNLHLPEKVRVVMGHTRWTTQGSEKLNYNNHPFSGNVEGHHFALAHNGVLYNDEEARLIYDLPSTGIQTDSYVAVQLIEKAGELNFDSLKFMAEKLMGSFVFTVLDNADNMYFVRGDNPLKIYHFYKHGFYLYASTDEILEKTLLKTGLSRLPKSEIKVEHGDILRIANNGNIDDDRFNISSMYDDYFCLRWGKAPTSFEIEQLKEFAGYFGYDESIIDELIAEGYTVDEIEELLYEPDELLLLCSDAVSVCEENL